MKATDINNRLIDTYLRLLNSLNLENKLELISRLTHSMKKERKDETELKQLYGAWKDDKSGEQLIKELRNDRSFNQGRASL